jgi:adenosylcobinamide-phosphate synthase
MASALLLDRVLGEVPRLHPLVGFGKFAARIERHMNGSPRSCLKQRAAGVLAWLVSIIPWLLITLLLWQQAELRPTISVIVLYFALGMQSLGEHANRIQSALEADDLTLARQHVGDIVSRDTASMHPEDISRAAVESVLENGSDAVFAALFWFAVAGAPGVLLYRLSNTLDAMWGYRTPRFLYFGWAAARLDDVLNYIPARLTALTYALLGRTRLALHCWQQQAPAWDSPNAGPVMASGAGSLNLKLGGAAIYHGKMEQRPILGTEKPAQAADIGRAMTLVTRGAWLWAALILLAGIIHA